MKNLPPNDNPSKTPPRLPIVAAAWRWLIEPPASIIQSERRFQARLLMAMLLVLFSLGLVSLVLSLLGAYSLSREPGTLGPIIDWITLAALVLLATGYGLSRSGYYRLAGWLAVGIAWIATFVSAIINPGNLGPQFFLVLGGLVASLFLSAGMTALVFVFTFIGFLLFPLFFAGFSTSTDVDALFFIVMVGGLVVMAAALRQRYLAQIDWQTQQLIHREAQLRELSIRDPLTGLFNRRYLEELLTLEMLRAARKEYPIGIIMADIDHFKRINDTHGHAAGDAALVQLAKFFCAHVRSSDTTCRYGGEEFVLILPEASQAITLKRAELILAGARHLHLEFEGQALEAITLSLGVAVFPRHGATIDALLGAADDALYRAKNDGRDRAVAAK